MKFSIIKRQPSYFFENMHEDLNRFLVDTFGEQAFKNTNTANITQLWRPAIEIKETKESYKLKAELPNVNKENIDIEMEKNKVVIKAETKKSEEHNEENLHLSEFRYGKFYRSIPLEHSIDVENSKAEFENGILNIELKKIEPTKPEVKKLEIQ